MTMKRLLQIKGRFLHKIFSSAGVMWRALATSAAGDSLVEMAFVLPLLTPLLLGVIDFGRAYYLSIEVSNAARAGAQYGVLNPTDTSGMEQAATNDARDVPGGVSPTAASGCECSDGSSGQSPCPATPPSCAVNVVNYVQVSTTATYTPMIKWPGIPSSIAMKGYAMMRTPQ
jgi:Flp pilus assembly protein TadG